MHAGGNQELVQEAVDELAGVSGTVHEILQAVDPAVDNRPHVAHHDAEDAGDEDSDEEDELGATVGAEDFRELGVAELVEHPAVEAAEDDADEDAHVDDLDTQDDALTGAIQAAGGIDEHVVVGEPGVVSIQEDQEGRGGDDRRVAGAFLGESAGEADAEDQAEVADHAGVDTGVDELAEHNHRRGHALHLEDNAHRQQDTGDREEHDGLDDGAGEALHRTLNVEVHPIPSRNLYGN